MINKPFVYGTSVKGDHFTDRKKESQRLIKDFEHGINTIIISPRRMGKTSLVKRVTESIKNENIQIVFMAWMLCAPIRAGEIVVFDKAYVDFEHLHHLHCRGITWVTRAKDNMCFEVMGQQLSEEEIQQAQHMYESGIFMGQQPIVLSDCKIKLTSENTFGKYPDELRMITACVLQDGKPVIMRFITNHFEWSAYSICDLYLARWGIEVFFKEIKQTLQLADFLGTSENAIKWQIWIALLTYLLLRLVAWLGGWKRSFRRFFTLVKGVLWSQRSLRALITIIDKTEERGTSPPIKLSAIQMQFDFGNI